MKAALLESIKNLKVMEVETPRVDDNSALMRVRSCGLCGSDLKFFNHGDRVKSFPAILGHEIAGEVVEVGNNVKNLHSGDRIALGNEIPCKECEPCINGLENICDNVLSVGTTVPGGFAEYMLLDKHMLSRGTINSMPKNLSFDEAALSEPLGCVINGFEFANMRSGKSVLIVGAGPIGCMMINTARLMGAKRIVVAEMLEKRIKFAEKFGADQYIKSEKFLDEALRISKSGYDVVMSACNSVKAHEQSIKAVAKGGFVNLFSGVAKGLPDIVSFNNNFIHYRQCAVGGSFSLTGNHHKKALDCLASGKIETKKLITHKFGLDDIHKAFGTLEKMEGLKIIINP